MTDEQLALAERAGVGGTWDPVYHSLTAEQRAALATNEV